MIKQFMLTILLLGIVFIHQGQSVAVKQTANFVPEVDPIDAMVLQQIKNFSVSYNSEKLTFERVTQCYKQTVAGKIYDMVVEFANFDNETVEYNVVIYVKPWEKYVEVQKFQKIDSQQTQEIQEKAQEVPQEFKQPKAFSDIMNQGAAQFIGKKVNETNKPEEINFSSETDLIKVMIENQIQSLLNSTASIKITKAVKQVVSGLKYYLEFTDGQNTYSADFIIQLWNNTIKAINFQKISSENQPEEAQELSEQMDGGKFEVDLDNEDRSVKTMIAQALREKLQNLELVFEDLHILQATKQVVAGDVYELYFTYKEREYFTQIYVVPWLNKVEVQKFTGFNVFGEYQNNHLQGGYRGDMQFFRFNEESQDIQNIIKKTIVSAINVDNESTLNFFKTKKQPNGNKYKLTFTDGTLYYKAVLTVDVENKTAQIEKIFKFSGQQFEEFKQKKWGGMQHSWNSQQGGEQQGNFRGGKKCHKNQESEQQQQDNLQNGFFDSKLVGGFQEIDFSKVDSGIQNMILGAIGNKVNQQASDIQVVKAQVQVVNGLNYKLTFKIGESLNYVEVFVQPLKQIVTVNNLKQNI